MKIKVSEALGVQLDWLVAKCEGPNTIASCYLDDEGLPVWLEEAEHHEWEPSTNWAQGGPIIERELIQVSPEVGKQGAGNAWWAVAMTPFEAYGPTPLIAAMRCYVASKLSDEVEVPDELK